MKIIINWFRKIWTYFKSFRYTYIPNNPITSTVQEDTRDKEAVKRMHKAYDAQEESHLAMAKTPHHCTDPLTCDGTCYKWEHDKIVEVKPVRTLKKRRISKRGSSQESYGKEFNKK